MSWRRKEYERGRGRERRTTGRRWMRMRHVVLIEEPVCKICGRKASTQVDHRLPVCQGGTDERKNLQGVCEDCHEEKTAEDLGIKSPPNKIGIDGYPIPKERKQDVQV